MQSKADAGIARGFVQIYEDAKGQLVIAVNYWKPNAVVKTRPIPKPKAKADEPVEDHTDDLYFAKPGAKAKKRKRVPDHNQLDLFGAAREGAGEADPPNPLVVIVDEEVDGATFDGIEEKG